MMTAHGNQQGFTLIEVLVALTLMALVSLISWRGLDAVQRTGEGLDERAEETLSLVRVLGQLERDILLHAGPDILPIQDARPARATAAARMPAGITWDPAAGLSLVRAAGEGRWQALHWYLKDGRLFRSTGAPSHRLPLPPADAGIAVLEHVRALTVKVWQPGQGWTDPSHSAPRTAAGFDPSGMAGLEIALYRQGVASDQPYRKVVVLP
ncbi:prepilin-type N-terminal cleavage/methylation domain-containing protein [Parapusillimonas sp. SGNA-6]|nr:prepilin-type N-terminal cleavage/methylation domain-containing protein [Parapusillimonas sp. SGNA-6]